jgi:hypothetical protein
VSVGDRYRLLDRLRPLSAERTACCRRKRIASTVQVQSAPDGSVGYAGIMACGSVWSCPVCASKIYGNRADEVQSAVKTWRALGRPLCMLTLTVRHAKGHDLKTLRRGLAKAWRRLWQGRAGERRKRDWRTEHSVRALEVTHGENGWHPHLHVILFQSEAPLPGALAELQAAWQAAVANELGPDCAPTASRGVDVRPLENERYLSKLGLEVSSIATKKGRRKSRTAWQIATDAAGTDHTAGDGRSRGLWRVFTRDMKGARQLFWSRGARTFFRLGKEVSDEELASDGIGVLLAEWDGAEWDRLCRAFPHWLTMVTEAVASGTLAELPSSGWRWGERAAPLGP